MKRLLGVVTFIGVLVTAISALAGPGTKKWEYKSAGGEDVTGVVINSKGDRILGTSVYTSKYIWSVVSLDKDGHFKWQKTYDPGTGKLSALSAIAVDSNDNVIVGAMVEDSSNKFYWYVVSYSSTGSQNWEKLISVGQITTVVLPPYLLYCMRIDSNDNIILGGQVLTASGERAYVLSLDKNGNKNWDAYPSSKPSSVYQLAIDSHNNVIAVTEESNTTKDLLITSFSPSGGKNWDAIYDSGKDDYVEDVAVGLNDSVVVVGEKSLSSTDSHWIIFSIDSTGHLSWEDSYGGSAKKLDFPASTIVDPQGNIVVAGIALRGTYADIRVVSYTPSGGKKWETFYDSSSHDYDGMVECYSNKLAAIDKGNNIIVAGYEGAFPGKVKLKLLSFSLSGTLNWEQTYISTDNAAPTSIVIDPDSGEMVVGATLQNPTTYSNTALVVDYEGATPPTPTPSPSGRILYPGDVRWVSPAAESPDPDHGVYLGFGDVVANGTHFKVEAAFPNYLKDSDNSTLAVKIFIAAQMPDDYTRLAYFDDANNLMFQPPDTLSSWKASVTGGVGNTIVFPEIDLSTTPDIPSGIHYWYTLVVPDDVPDDFSGVDWSITPWEITVNVFEVK